MLYLADTNIVARWVQIGDPLYPTVRQAILTLNKRGDTVYITPQVLTEFWALATRPVSANGFGISVAMVVPRIHLLLRHFSLLPETPAIYPYWQQLVETHAVIGRQVYDARLVAVMQAHRVTHLLTFNGSHFLRFPGITVVDPAKV